MISKAISEIRKSSVNREFKCNNMKRRISVGGFGGDNRTLNVGTDYSFLFMCHLLFAQTNVISTKLPTENMDWQMTLFTFDMVHMRSFSCRKHNLGLANIQRLHIHCGHV